MLELDDTHYIYNCSAIYSTNIIICLITCVLTAAILVIYKLRELKKKFKFSMGLQSLIK